MIKLENEYLKIEINTLGAELNYIFKDNKNLLWTKCDLWNRQSPILFPMIGRCRDKSYYYNNEEYVMEENHGFANKSLFEVVEVLDNSITLLLKENSNTLTIYPFKFNLYVTYTLIDNKIDIKWKVVNTDNKEIYFNIGGHPGFIIDKTSKIVFDNEVDYTIYEIVNNELGNMINYDCKLKEVDMYKLINKHNTVIFKGVNNATLHNDDYSIRIDTDTPYLAFWHNNNNFICIEPWCGLPEVITNNKHIEDKYEIIKLNINKEYTNGYSITINKKR